MRCEVKLLASDSSPGALGAARLIHFFLTLSEYVSVSSWRILLSFTNSPTIFAGLLVQNTLPRTSKIVPPRILSELKFHQILSRISVLDQPYGEIRLFQFCKTKMSEKSEKAKQRFVCNCWFKIHFGRSKNNQREIEIWTQTLLEFYLSSKSPERREAGGIARSG